MAAGVLLPVSSEAHQCCYEGYISAKQGGLEYSLRLTIPNQSIKDARLECDWKLRNLLRGHEKTVQKRLSESADLDQFLLELRAIIQRQEHISWLTSSDIMPGSSYKKLMADLDELGWSRVIHVSPDLTLLRLRAHDGHGRGHDLMVTVSSQYPTRPPAVSADVPLGFQLQWTFPGAGCSLLGLIQQFERWLLQFDVFWQVMEEVDGECWVLEPERPTRACTSRRVVIGENLSLNMILEPLSPTDVPRLMFMGADHAVAPLNSKWSSSRQHWDAKISVLNNLRRILCVSFPPMPDSTDVEEEGECTICYAYRFDGHTPSVVCGNKHCAKLFHNQCLYDYLISTVKVDKNAMYTFNTLTAKCPLCEQPISITVES